MLQKIRSANDEKKLVLKRLNLAQQQIEQAKKNPPIVIDQKQRAHLLKIEH